MECDHTIVIARVVSVDQLAAKRRAVPSQADKILCEAVLVAHGLISGIKGNPLQQMVLVGKVLVPLAVLEKLLPHKDMGNARSRKQQSRRNLGAAARPKGLSV